MERLITSIIVGIFVTVFTVSCSTTHLVKPDEELSIEKKAKLVKNDGEIIEVYNIFARGDSLVAIDLSSEGELQLHINEIQSLVVKNRRKGALLGMLAGGPIGGLAARLLIGPAAEFYSPLFFIPPGALIGALIGYISGSEAIYTFPVNSAGQKSADSLSQGKPKILPASRSTSTDSVSVIPPESITQMAIKRNPNRSERRFHDPANQIAGGYFIFPGQSSVDFVAAGHLRRFFDPKSINLPEIADKLLGRPDKYYYDLAGRVSGGTDKEDGYNNSWGSELMSLSIGAEGYRSGTPQRGKTGFAELGMINGSVWDYGFNSENYSSSKGLGVIVAAGGRMWYHLLFGEIQVAYDTRTSHLVPSVVAGYRF